jgi:hypothetical protein
VKPTGVGMISPQATASPPLVTTMACGPVSRSAVPTITFWVATPPLLARSTFHRSAMATGAPNAAQEPAWMAQPLTESRGKPVAVNSTRDLLEPGKTLIVALPAAVPPPTGLSAAVPLVGVVVAASAMAPGATRPISRASRPTQTKICRDMRPP